MNDTPVLLLSGTHTFRCLRTLEEVISHQREEGWKVEYVDGQDRETLSSHLQGRGSFLFGEESDNTLVVVRRSNKVDVDLVLQHHDNPEPSVVLLLYQEGKAKGSHKKLSEHIDARLVHDLPPLYKADQEAIDFCIEESERHGKEISYRLASAIVDRCGNDLGYLRFEILKACTLAGDSRELTVEHVGRSLAPVREVPVDRLIRAISVRDAAASMRAFSLIEQTHSGDPTVKICRYLLSKVVMWLAASDLLSKGFPEKEAAGRMEVHPVVYQKAFLPAARVWGKEDLRALLKAISRSDRLARSGAVDAWSGLTAGALSCIVARTSDN